jgi:D-glycero-alpha-D-manno-heptose-7-phosphate kinase
VSFAGGGTDLDPYSSDFGGSVLAGTIGLFVEVLVQEKSTLGVSIFSIDTGYRKIDAEFLSDEAIGENLLTACLSIIPLEMRDFVSVTVKSPVPPRSGLGASSAIVLAVTAGILKYFGIPYTNEELAMKAFHIERVLLGIPGGCQDQYVCAFGSLNRFDFRGSSLVRVEPLGLEEADFDNLSASCVLAWTGVSRNSSLVIEDAAKDSSSETKLANLHSQKELVDIIQNHFTTSSYREIGMELTKGWELKKRLSPFITTTKINSIFEAGISAGAFGGKLLGAGGGGFILFLGSKNKIPKISASLIDNGVEVSPITFVTNGVEALVVT